MRYNFGTEAIKLRDVDLRMFDTVTDSLNRTTDGDLSPGMKTFYSKYLIENAKPKLVHDQFAQKHPIPRNGGKTIEFRKYAPLDKATTPLTEGVTPSGKPLSISTITAAVAQYGDYVAVSDILQLTAIDNTLAQATKLLSNQAGATLDTVTREVLCGGTNVQYGENSVSARHLLVGGESSGNHYLTVQAIKLAARYLKVMNGEKIGDSYVAIIHEDIAYDLTNDKAWVDVKTYADPGDMYTGEIGKLYGVRFIATTEAKKIVAPNLTAGARNLTIKTTLSVAGKTLDVNEEITDDDAAALKGRKIILAGKLYTVKSATAGAAGAAKITVSDTDPNISTDDGVKDAVIYPGEAGAKGRDVYVTLVLADNAYGTTEIEGGGLEHIFKPLGSGGTSDPLNQRATVGWKATKTAERLVEEFIIRIETTSTFNDHISN